MNISADGRRRFFFKTGLCLFLLFLLLLLPVRGASAASGKASPSRIRFTDGSGSYLVRSGSTWILKNAKGRVRTGLQYLSIPKTGTLSSGFYVFNKKGCLLKRRAVYKFNGIRIGNITFNGYYCTGAGTGRLFSSPLGLVHLRNIRCGSRIFDGYYYVGPKGRLSTDVCKVRALPRTVIEKKVIPAGIYYFTTMGRLCRAGQFHTIKKQTAGGITFNGKYYFASGGALRRKAGLITIKGQKYMLTSQGKAVTDVWQDGYYFLSDGRMACSMRVPDGTYVGANGKKIYPSQTRLAPLKKDLESVIRGYPGEWSVYVKNLKTGDIVLINDRPMYAASTIKPFIMASTFRLIAQKKLSYSTEVQSLLRDMITVSDNNAANQLVTLNGNGGGFRAGLKTVNAWIAANGFTETQIHHSLNPSALGFVSDSQARNTCSAADAGVLLEQIYRGACVSSDASRKMMDLLLRQTYRWKIPAGVPAGTTVANKTGENVDVQHDMAIIKAPECDYILCVFATTSSESAGISGIKNISSIVYKWFT